MHKFFANTHFLGKKVFFLPYCHSTNDEAMQLINEEHSTEGTVIITSHQIKGRGQRGNTWVSEEGKNITFSLILKPNQIKVTQQFLLHMITTIAIHRVLFPVLGKYFKIKWPNDLYYKDLKLGGILIENILRGQNIEYAIVGIGINVNQLHFALDNATSLAELTQMEYDTNDLIEQILIKMEEIYFQLDQNSFEKLKSVYLSKLYLFNHSSTFMSQNRRFHGAIVGISEIGRLQVKEDNAIHEYDFKEIEFVR